MKPTAEMVERARALLRWNHDEFCEATIKHVHEIGGADVRYMTPGAKCECKHRHIAQALADEHERATEPIEHCAIHLDERAAAATCVDCSMQLESSARSLRAIRAAAMGATDEPR